MGPPLYVLTYLRHARCVAFSFPSPPTAYYLLQSKPARITHFFVCGGFRLPLFFVLLPGVVSLCYQFSQQREPARKWGVGSRRHAGSIKSFEKMNLVQVSCAATATILCTLKSGAGVSSDGGTSEKSSVKDRFPFLAVSSSKHSSTNSE